MKVTISSGHGKYVSGASSIIDEVTEARKVVDRVVDILKEMGEPVNVYHDNTSKNKKDNVNNIVKQHNLTTRDKDVSIHFNASTYTKSAVGVEVLYKTATNKDLASKLSKAISVASGLKDRGAKQRDNLGFLNNTNKGAVLIEICFVDSEADVKIYKEKFEDICIAIAETISGKSYKKVTNTDKKTYFRVIAGSYTERANAEAMKNRLMELGIPAFLEAVVK